MAKKKTYTDKQIQEWKAKAEKWDALDKRISKYYAEPGEEEYDEEFDKIADQNGLLGIGEDAAIAFGYL